MLSGLGEGRGELAGRRPEAAADREHGLKAETALGLCGFYSEGHQETDQAGASQNQVLGVGFLEPQSQSCQINQGVQCKIKSEAIQVLEENLGKFLYGWGW